MRRTLLTGVVVVTAALAACSNSRAPGQATLTATGTVRVAHAGGGTTSARGNETVRRGDTVRVQRGTAHLAFSDGRTIDLRKGSSVKIDQSPTLVAGDALVQTGQKPFTVKAAGSTVALDDGAAHLVRNLGIRAAVYRGSATVSSAGHDVTVPALREASVPTLGVVPAAPSPIRLDSTEQWDRRFLGDAIELSDQLDARSNGLSGQLPPGEGHTPGFFRIVLPPLDKESSFGESLLDPTRPPGETLVGAALVVDGRTGTFTDRWSAVFSFRDQGASWGLVALDQKVKDVPGLSSTLDAALARAQTFTLQAAAAAAAPPPVPPADTSTTTPTEQTGAGSPNGPGTATGTGGASGGTGGTTPPPTTAPPLPTTPVTSPSPLQPVVDTVGGLLSGLLGALGG
jgi:hypothetical protein